MRENPQWGIVCFVFAVETGEQALAEYIAAGTAWEAAQWQEVDSGIDASLLGQEAYEQWLMEENKEAEPEPELRQHIQGFIQFKKPTARKDVSFWLQIGFAKPHYEDAKGSAEQNLKYCTKEGGTEVIRHGKFHVTAGQRSDLEEIRVMLMEGGSMRTVADAKFTTWVRNYRALGYYMSMVRGDHKRTTAPEVFVFWGKAGTGKTRKVYEMSPDVYVVPISSSNTLWFDGYDGKSDVLFDDFYGGIKFNKMLQLLDRYKIQVPIKGGFVGFQPSRIFITSNTAPRSWYAGVPEEARAALHRRITKVTHFVKPFAVYPSAAAAEAMEDESVGPLLGAGPAGAFGAVPSLSWDGDVHLE